MPKLILCRHGQGVNGMRKIYLPVGKMFNCQNKGEMKPSLQVKN